MHVSSYPFVNEQPGNSITEQACNIMDRLSSDFPWG